MHVLIATARRSDLLRRTLESLADCRRPEGFAGVYVVENGAQSGVESLVAEFAQSLNARYRFEPVGNKNRAINRGLREIKAGLVVLYDDDVRLSPDSLVAYAEAAARWPRAPFFGGQCLCDYEQPPASHVAPLLPLCARGWTLGKTGEPITLPHALGFNWAVRAEVVLELGGFIEDRGPGTAVIVGDELDMQKRMIGEIEPGRFVEEAQAWHYIPADRCSEQWLVNRGYHYGFARAMEERNGQPIGGVPLWARRRLWTSTLKWLAARATGDPAFRLRTTYGRQINRGLVAGFRSAVSTDTQNNTGRRNP